MPDFAALPGRKHRNYRRRRRRDSDTYRTVGRDMARGAIKPDCELGFLGFFFIAVSLFGSFTPDPSATTAAKTIHDSWAGYGSDVLMRLLLPCRRCSAHHRAKLLLSQFELGRRRGKRSQSLFPR